MVHNLEDLMADYLSDSMDAETRREFEHRMAADPQLAARIALEQDIIAALDATSPEHRLRANLQKFSEKYNSLESLSPKLEEAAVGKARRWLALVAVLLFLAGLVFWNLRQQVLQTMPQSPQPKLESPTEAPAEDLQKANEAEKPNPIKQQPIAAAFKPMAKLEAYIGAQTRSGNFRFRVSEPQSGAALPVHAGQTTFRFSGKVEGKAPEGATFNVKIFNNNLQRFEAMQPVDNHALELNPDGEFLFQKNLRLPHGLYYLLIEDPQSGEWVFVDRFLVK